MEISISIIFCIEIIRPRQITGEYQTNYSLIWAVFKNLLLRPTICLGPSKPRRGEGSFFRQLSEKLRNILVTLEHFNIMRQTQLKCLDVDILIPV